MTLTVGYLSKIKAKLYNIYITQCLSENCLLLIVAKYIIVSGYLIYRNIINVLHGEDLNLLRRKAKNMSVAKVLQISTGRNKEW